MDGGNEEKNLWWRQYEQHRVMLAMDFWMSVGFVESDFQNRKTWEKALRRGPIFKHKDRVKKTKLSGENPKVKPAVTKNKLEKAAAKFKRAGRTEI